VNNPTGSGTGSGSVTVEGGSLGGIGRIAGPVTILPGGTMAPGVSLGVLTISNSLTLSGTTVMELNAATRTNDSVRGLTTVTYGGTLVLSNLAGTITPSNTFKLFSANSYDGVFSGLSPVTPGMGLAWNTNTLAADGTLRVVSTAPVPIATGFVTPCATSQCLSISWPGDHIGWRLQVQTNSISPGLGPHWFDVPNSMLTNHMIFTIDPTGPGLFYRLVYP
jgi:hypothetical protein